MPGKYDPINNVTNYFDESGKFIDSKSGDTSADKTLTLLPDTKGGSFLARKMDTGALMSDLASDLIPAATTAFLPEFKTLSPLKNVLARMGLSFIGGTAADQALNFRGDKSLAESATDSAVNTGIGVGLPELLPGFGRVKVGIGPRVSRSVETMGPSVSDIVASRAGETTGTRTNKGTQTRSGETTSLGSTESSGSGSTARQSETISGLPNTKVGKIYPTGRYKSGQFVTAEDRNLIGDVEIPGMRSTYTGSSTNEQNSKSSHLNENTSKATVDSINEALSQLTNQSNDKRTATRTQGPRQRVTESPGTGMLHNIIDIIQSIKSQPRGTITKGQSSLLGLLGNLGFDTLLNRPTKEQ